MEDVTQQKVWNTKQMAWIVGFAISITFGATMIWGRFLFVENKTDAIDAKVEYVNDRLDKISSRNKESIEKNTKEIEQLKLPNTDK
jgi:hypothetical protein